MFTALDHLRLTYMLLPVPEENAYASYTPVTAAAVEDDEDEDEGDESHTSGKHYPTEPTENAISKEESSRLESIYQDFVRQRVVPFGAAGTAKTWHDLVNTKGRSVWTAGLWFDEFIKSFIELAYTMLEHRKNALTSEPGKPIKRVYALTPTDKASIRAFYYSHYVKTHPKEHPTFTNHAAAVALALRPILQDIQIRAGLAPRRIALQSWKPVGGNMIAPSSSGPTRLAPIPHLDHLTQEEALQILKDAEADTTFRKIFKLSIASKKALAKIKANAPDLKKPVNWTSKRGNGTEGEGEEAPTSTDTLAPKAGKFVRTAPATKAGEGPAEISKLEKDVSEVIKVLNGILAEAGANRVFEGPTGEVFVTKFLNVLKDRKFPKAAMKRPAIEGPFEADDRRLTDWCTGFVTAGLMSESMLVGVLNGVAKQGKAIDVLTGMAVDANNGEQAAESPAAKAAYAARLGTIQALFKKWLASTSSTSLDKALDSAIKKTVKDFKQEPFIEDEKPTKKPAKAPAKKAAAKPEPVKEEPKKKPAKAPAKKAAKKAAPKTKPAAKKPAAKKPVAKKPKTSAKRTPAKKPAKKAGKAEKRASSKRKR